jgi:hypothetical protein
LIELLPQKAWTEPACARHDAATPGTLAFQLKATFLSVINEGQHLPVPPTHTETLPLRHCGATTLTPFDDTVVLKPAQLLATTVT